MILINGKKVIKDVTVGTNGQFEIITTLSPFSEKKVEVITKDCFADNYIPFIDCPVNIRVLHEEIDNKRCYGLKEIGNVDDFICRTGYVHVEDGHSELAQIKIDHVVVDKIVIKTKAYKGAYSYGLSYEEFIEFRFNYYFSLKVCLDNNSYQDYTFEAYKVNRIRSFRDKRLYDNGPILTLFEKIIPLINDYVNSGNSLADLNLAYLSCLLPQEEENNNVHPFTFKDALEIIYNMQIKEDKGLITIDFGKDLEPYMNVYIVALIDSILNVNLQLIENEKIYRCCLPDSFAYPNDIISLRNYLLCILFCGVYCNYSIEESKAKYLVKPSAREHYHIDLDKDCLKDPPCNNFLSLFDFIADMEATHFVDGQYRPGRDDYEWKEKTFSIPDKANYTPSEEILSKINELLGIKLEFQKGNETKYGDAHPALYYYYERYDDGYVGGLASRRTDIGSEELKKRAFFKLIDFFIKDINKM